MDTDVVSFLISGKGEHARFGELIRGHLLVVSFATVAELLVGAAIAGWGERKISQLEDSLKAYVVVPGTEAVARAWARLSARFRDQVSENDLWIAASSLAQVDPPPIVTNNLRHFRPIADEFALELVHPDL
ncbi:MAG: PIN domain-containing protein [Actinomycetota bacterium]